MATGWPTEQLLTQEAFVCVSVQGGRESISSWHNKERRHHKAQSLHLSEVLKLFYAAYNPCLMLQHISIKFPWKFCKHYVKNRYRGQGILLYSFVKQLAAITRLLHNLVSELQQVASVPSFTQFSSSQATAHKNNA